MYCRNCAKELIGVPEYCMNCGVRPPAGYSFCQNCAAPTTALSEICVKCGTRLIRSPVQGTQTITAEGARSKSTSVLLAVFLSFWTWLYTYRRDNWKFWIAFALWVFQMLVASALQGNASWYPRLVVPVIWVWAILDTSLKNDIWYSHYKRKEGVNSTPS
jgi:hypothetical protein